MVLCETKRNEMKSVLDIDRWISQGSMAFMPSFGLVWFGFVWFRFGWFRLGWFRFVWFRFGWFRFGWFRFGWFRFVSFRFANYSKPININTSIPGDKLTKIHTTVEIVKVSAI